MDRHNAPQRRRPKAKLAAALVYVLFFATFAILQLVAPEIRLKSTSHVRPWLVLLIGIVTLGIIPPVLTSILREWRTRKKGD